MSHRSRTALAALAFGLPALAAGTALATPLTLTTPSGTLTGTAATGMYGTIDEYLGIPYAAPPVGALRWQPPQPATWSGTLQATTLPPACPQGGLIPLLVGGSSESCLFLNVYVPPNAGSNLPVMVWIHGGADSSGTGGEYDGSALASKGVIVVTINYRLGFFGFLAHPALDAGSQLGASGDYGLMDQQAALKWVRANIAAFGGNPANVTAFGESAGAQNLYDQLASPTGLGLFQKVILESGTYAASLPSHAETEKLGVSFGDSVGCTSTTDPSCLRALSAQTIVNAEDSGLGVSSLTEFEPSVGTAVLPVQPAQLIALGLYAHVPVLQGTNHDEARVFVAADYDQTAGVGPLTAAGYPAAIDSLGLASVEPYVADFYPLASYPSPDVAFSSLYTDAGFSCGAYGFDQLFARTVPVYAYEFADEGAGAEFYPTMGDTFSIGAPHASELPFIWPQFFAENGPTYGLESTSEHLLGTLMQSAWTNFAKTGNPNGAGVPAWPAFNLAAGKYSQVETLAPGAGGVAPTTGFNTFHKCGFWAFPLSLDAILPPGSF